MCAFYEGTLSLLQPAYLTHLLSGKAVVHVKGIVSWCSHGETAYPSVCPDSQMYTVLSAECFPQLSHASFTLVFSMRTTSVPLPIPILLQPSLTEPVSAWMEPFSIQKTMHE